MKKLLIAAIILLAAAWPTWRYIHPATHIVYETAPVERGDIQSTVTATGSVNPLHTVGVGAQISGVITKLYVDYESKVHKGELLAEIDPRSLQDAMKSAESDVQTAEAAVTAADAALRVAETGINAARNEVARYQALSKQFASVEQHYEVELDRQVNLGPIASTDDVASAKATRDLAQDDETAATAQVEVSQLNVEEKIAERDAAKAQLESAQGQLEQSQAALQQARVNLERTKILSPINGTVLVVDVAVGQTVAASMQVPELFQIAEDLTKVQIDVDIDESDVSRIAAGDTANFTVDAFPRVTFNARVREIRKSATNVNNVISYDVVLDVVHTPAQLLPGMTANVHILSAVHHDVIKVPNAALRYHGNKTISVLNSNGRPEERKITTGLADPRETEILSGNLAPGENVITSESSR